MYFFSALQDKLQKFFKYPLVIKYILTPKNSRWIAISFVSIYWLLIILQNSSSTGFNYQHALKDTGGLAWLLLLFTIFVSLVSKIFSKNIILKKILPLRKHTGILAFLVALSHGLFYFIPLEEWNIIILGELIYSDKALTFGSIAFFTMLFPFATSTIWAVRFLGPKFWKNIQRLAHVSFIATVFHLMFLGIWNHNSLDFQPLVILLGYGMGYGYVFYRKYKKI